VFLAEAALYSAITPLLAHYAQTVHISRVQAGILSGTYALGLIPGSLLAGWLSRRIGVRSVTIAGIAAFAVLTAAFGASHDLAALDLTRGGQGLAAGCMWGGALTWLVDASPRERLGEYLGTAFGISILGTLIGPLIGVVAVAVGTGRAYGVAALALIPLIAVLLRASAPTRFDGPPVGAAAIVRDPQIRLGIWLVLLAAGALGTIGALLPLRLHAAGISPEGVGGIFALAALLAAALSRTTGRLLDRRGALPMSRLGLALASPVLIALAFGLDGIGLAVVTVAGVGLALTGIVVPASRLLVGAAQEAGLAPAISASMILFSLALGEGLASPAGAALATAVGYAGPFLVLGGLTALTLLLERLRWFTSSTASPFRRRLSTRSRSTRA
jgi:MFS family permease